MGRRMNIRMPTATKPRTADEAAQRLRDAGLDVREPSRKKPPRPLSIKGFLAALRKTKGQVEP
jgi:hypothetical protein